MLGISSTCYDHRGWLGARCRVNNSVCPSLWLSSVCLSQKWFSLSLPHSLPLIPLETTLFVSLRVSVFLCLCLCVFVSVCLSVCFSLSLSLSARPSVRPPSVCLSVCLSPFSSLLLLKTDSYLSADVRACCQRAWSRSFSRLDAPRCPWIPVNVVT